MTLAFSTKWPKSMGDLAGQPNFFTNKIMRSMWQFYAKETRDFIFIRSESENKRFDEIKPFEKITVYENSKLIPKLHTIREDPHNRWKAGMDIHFVINNRTKNRFQFAPVIKCASVQKIEIEWTDSGRILGREARVYIDGTKRMGKYTENERFHLDGPGRSIEMLAHNDGFDSLKDFFAYFNEPFKGKIIHWTDIKY